MDKMKKNAAIIGIGLLGSSLGMALRNKGYLRSGWTRRPEITRWALDHDAIDIGYDTIEEAFSSAAAIREQNDSTNRINSFFMISIPFAAPAAVFR